MFSYNLTGKQVLIVLSDALLESLKPIGVSSPLLARVFQMEERGIWLDAPRFPVCPIDGPHLYGPGGDAFCHAHVFIPSDGIVSVAVFPRDVAELGYGGIGFKPPSKPGD
jgi:hypothetical protein